MERRFVSRNTLPLAVKYGMMSTQNLTCMHNCSGHGECHNGTCLCEIQFEGELCHSPNVGYFFSFAAIFFLIGLVCIIQLVTCIVAEYQKMKAPSLLRACKITTQKLLYFVAFLAAIMRGASFTTLEEWSKNFVSAHYPLLLSGVSLVICFWAEAFHLPNINREKRQFLSKSFVGFVSFNAITYSLLLAEFITKQFYSTEYQKIFYSSIFNGCYAFLLFICVIFFLIYGVEVYFKIHGRFLIEVQVNNISSNNRSPVSERGTSSRLVNFPDISAFPISQQKVDESQLKQSRFGLVAQAVMLTVVVLFLCTEAFEDLWKSKVPLYSRNWRDVVFHVMELGVILWFPCVLWNCLNPEQLWVLNPKRLLKKFDLESTKIQECVDQEQKDLTSPLSDETDADKDCWICYVSDKEKPLIQPCQCRGDVSSVHHDCLRRWLMESAGNPDSLKCKVCGTPYQVERTTDFKWRHGFTTRQWVQNIAMISFMCTTAVVGWIVIQVLEYTVYRLLAVGSILLTEYVCIKFLSQHTLAAYQRAQVSALNIMDGNHMSTISETVTVDHPKGETEACA